MSRSNKEEREKTLGTGLLEGARRGLSGTKSRMELLEEEALGSPKKKRKPKEDSE